MHQELSTFDKFLLNSEPDVFRYVNFKLFFVVTHVQFRHETLCIKKTKIYCKPEQKKVIYFAQYDYQKQSMNKKQTIPLLGSKI